MGAAQIQHHQDRHSARQDERNQGSCSCWLVVAEQQKHVAVTHSWPMATLPVCRAASAAILLAVQRRRRNSASATAAAVVVGEIELLQRGCGSWLLQVAGQR